MEISRLLRWAGLALIASALVTTAGDVMSLFVDLESADEATTAG
jgi:hypothetical protein